MFLLPLVHDAEGHGHDVVGSKPLSVGDGAQLTVNAYYRRHTGLDMDIRPARLYRYGENLV